MHCGRRSWHATADQCFAASCSSRSGQSYIVARTEIKNAVVISAIFNHVAK